jgi:hypothetical protein
MDHMDAQLLDPTRVEMGIFDAVDDDLSGIRGVDAGKHLDQGGLAGAVLANQAMYGSAFDDERRPIEGVHAAEALF